MEEIIRYLKEKYKPCSIIVYGSYADGSNNEYSDFDALVITESGEPVHDISKVGEVQLDVFMYPAEYIETNSDPEQYAQIYDGVIVMDAKNRGAELKERITSYFNNLPRKTDSEINDELGWLGKMVLRAKRNDAEGMFRRHWLLTESLSIFCDIHGHLYRGPKKSLKWMEREFPEAFRYYSEALSDFGAESSERWVQYLNDSV